MKNLIGNQSIKGHDCRGGGKSAKCVKRTRNREQQDLKSGSDENFIFSLYQEQDNTCSSFLSVEGETVKMVELDIRGKENGIYQRKQNMNTSPLDFLVVLNDQRIECHEKNMVKKDVPKNN